jgi:hypothetical protein
MYFRAGLLKYPAALSMLQYLDKETKYVPWRSALKSLSYLKTVLSNRPSFGNLKVDLLSEEIKMR